MVLSNSFMGKETSDSQIASGMKEITNHKYRLGHHTLDFPVWDNLYKCLCPLWEPWKPDYRAVIKHLGSWNQVSLHPFVRLLSYPSCLVNVSGCPRASRGRDGAKPMAQGSPVSLNIGPNLRPTGPAGLTSVNTIPTHVSYLLKAL